MSVCSIQFPYTFISSLTALPSYVCQMCCRMTDKALEPHYTELANLEQQILDMWSKIRTSKANILKNEEKREKLLRGISFHHSA